jgi:hypothetical protein
LIISTPVTAVTSTNNINQFHVIEWSFNDFQELIKEHFKIDAVYTQNILTKSQIVDSLAKKIRYKLNPEKFQTFDSSLKHYKHNFDLKNVHSGFQLLVCTKE